MTTVAAALLAGSVLLAPAAPLAAQGVAATAPDQASPAAPGGGTPHDPAAAAPATPVDPGNVTKDAPAVPKGRADENVVRQAQDAFGSTIGRERIGIYSSSSVRGFSPIAAGNVRIDGLYFDQVGSLNSRIRRSTDIRVGLSVQGYACVDMLGQYRFSLRGIRWTAQVNVNNLLDKRYFAGVFRNSRDFILPGSPRAVLFTLRAELGHG